jgi:DNA-binding GntR family transcriptional regulator
MKRGQKVVRVEILERVTDEPLVLEVSALGASQFVRLSVE